MSTRIIIYSHGPYSSQHRGNIMDIAAAFQIVLDLAKQNVTNISDDSHEHARQMEAIDMVEDLVVNEYGDS